MSKDNKRVQKDKFKLFCRHKLFLLTLIYLSWCKLSSFYKKKVFCIIVKIFKTFYIFITFIVNEEILEKELLDILAHFA